MLLPDAQVASATISVTTMAKFGVIRSSWVATDGGGCQMTAAAVGVRLERSPFVSVGAAELPISPEMDIVQSASD